ncbi:MAG TPA: hypothetical protein VF473_10515 [Cyclobacteriaceae bacterium]
MNLDDLRKEITDRLMDVDSVNDLLALLHIINQMVVGPVNPCEFTPKQLQLLDESKQQIVRGEYLTLDEANRQIDKWLEEN